MTAPGNEGPDSGASFYTKPTKAQAAALAGVRESLSIRQHDVASMTWREMPAGARVALLLMATDDEGVSALAMDRPANPNFKPTVWEVARHPWGAFTEAARLVIGSTARDLAAALKNAAALR